MNHFVFIAAIKEYYPCERKSPGLWTCSARPPRRREDSTGTIFLSLIHVKFTCF